MRKKFKRGSHVVLCQLSWDPVLAKHFGDLARIEFSQEVCVNHHKGEYEWEYRIKFMRTGLVVPGVREVALELVDPITALGKLAPRRDSDE